MRISEWVLLCQNLPDFLKVVYTQQQSSLALQINTIQCTTHKHTLLTSQLEHPVSLDPRPEYQRAVINWSPSSDDQSLPSVSTTGSQCSSRLLSMRSADALLQLPARSEARAKLEAGAVVRVLLLR